jgi:hypothetical protein
MQCGNRSLQLVRPGAPDGERLLDQCEPFTNPIPVPQSTILVFEGYQAALFVDAGIAPRIVQQHESEQAAVLRLVRQKLAESPSQAYRLRAEFAADERVPGGGRVAFVEHQVDGFLDRRQALPQLGTRRHFVRNLRLLDLSLGPHQPLRHGDFRD